MSTQLFYDPDKTFDENFDHGPWLDKTPEPLPSSQPGFTFLGLPVNLPFGIPAGSLPNSKFIKAAFERGFDVVHYKTQRSIKFPANQFPNVIPIEVDLPAVPAWQTGGQVTLEKAEEGLVMADEWGEDPTKYTITNSFGNPSRGPEFWQDDMRVAVAAAKPGQIMVASVVGTVKAGFDDEDYWQDFADTAKLAKDAGAHAIELNLSCPNVANEGIVCYTKEAVVQTCRRTKALIGTTPLLIKIGYFTEDQQELLEEIIAGVDQYIAAIAAINTIPAAVYDKDGSQALPGEGRLKSGLCGYGIKWAGLDMVKRLDEIRDRLGYQYEILGVGGVMTPEDYHEYREAGADCIQSATGSMWNPELAKQIKSQTF